jgi:hypothetical protein
VIVAPMVNANAARCMWVSGIAGIMIVFAADHTD